jgi:hypothetical protein
LIPGIRKGAADKAGALFFCLQQTGEQKESAAA